MSRKKENKGQSGSVQGGVHFKAGPPTKYTVSWCFLEYAKEKKGKVLSLLLLILSVTFVTLVPPQLLKYVVDEVLLARKGKGLLLFAALYTGSYLFLGVLQFLQELLLVAISQGICRKLRTTMMKKIHRMEYRTFVRYEAAAMESYFNNDVGTIDTLITSGAVSMLIDLFKMIGIFLAIFLNNWKFGLVVLVFFPFLVTFALRVRKKMFDAQFRNRNQEQEVNRLVLENVENMQAIKNYGCEEWTEKKYDCILEKHFQASKETNFMDGIFSPVMETFKFLVIILLLALSGSGMWHFSISTGAVVALIALLLELFEPVENLGQELQTIQKSLSGLRRLNDFFALEEDVHGEAFSENQKHGQEIEKDWPGGRVTQQEDGKDWPGGWENRQDGKVQVSLQGEPVLEFRDVSFAYEENEPVISHFNLTAKGRERIVLSGRSGVGKSTIFKLAYGILKPTEGQVLLNGKSVFDLTQEERSACFGLVYQEPFFSGGTIYEELALTRGIPKEQVQQVLNQVGLLRITDLDQPLREQDFSSGELSLLNIARMLLSDCKIVFLDEMNARIDPVTAEHIIELMDQVTQDKMVFSINHYGESLKDSRVVRLV